MSKGQRKVDWSLNLENMRVRAGQFVSEAMGEPVETKRAAFREPRNSAVSARIAIEFSLGRATINALDVDSPLLFQAELHYVGELEYETSGEAERVIRLRQKANAPGALAAMMNDEEELHWDIALAPGIPLTLALKGGIGACDIDLSGLRAKRLRLETGLGQVQLTTPLQKTGFEAEVTGGVGKAAVTIPASGSAQLKIAGGVGEVGVTVAPEAAARLRGKTGLGGFSLPAGLKRVDAKGKGTGATWETERFADATDPIVIDYQGGIGRFSLKYFNAL